MLKQNESYILSALRDPDTANEPSPTYNWINFALDLWNFLQIEISHEGLYIHSENFSKVKAPDFSPLPTAVVGCTVYK